MTPVRLEPAALRSRVKHSTTEPLRSLSTDEPAASRLLEPFGEVGGDVPEYFLSRTQFCNIEDKKVIAKN